METSEIHKSEKLHIELLRIIATFLVIFNHTGTWGFFLFSVRQESSFYWMYLFCSILCKIAVPLFFMISGALLLPKAESIGTLYRKRVLRFLLVLLLFSSIQYIFRAWAYHIPISFGHFIRSIYSTNLATAYWFLYAYIGFLIMLPFLRKMAAAMSPNDYIYLAVCQLIIVGIIPILQYLIWQGNCKLNGSFSVAIITSSTIFFPLMGYFLEHRLSDDFFNHKSIWVCLTLSALAIGVCCIMTDYRNHLSSDWNEKTAQVFHNCLIALPAMSVYGISKHIQNRHKASKRLCAGLIYIGRLMFCVLLLENIFRFAFQGLYSALAFSIGSFPASLVYTTIVFISCCFVAYVLKHVPYLQSLL